LGFSVFSGDVDVVGDAFGGGDGSSLLPGEDLFDLLSIGRDGIMTTLGSVFGMISFSNDADVSEGNAKSKSAHSPLHESGRVPSSFLLGHNGEAQQAFLASPAMPSLTLLESSPTPDGDDRTSGFRLVSQSSSLDVAGNESDMSDML